MCQQPVTHQGVTFACRRCDECISQRRFDWVSRAMAERAMSRFTLSVTLTYNDETEHNREGAAMFRYSDVQLFLKRLRRAASRAKLPPSLRYICAGEQGDRNGRCHWHIILFSSYDVTELGDISSPYGPVTDRNDIVTSRGQRPLRRSWSIWPHGFVTFQEADEGGMHYALSYALKDQFAVDKAMGTKREARSETWATGFFRMSKEPPVGQTFIQSKLDRLAAQGAVLPNTLLDVPGLRGRWYPVGFNRKFLLSGLKAINDRLVTETGKPAPQWSSLLADCREREKDMEILVGPDPEEELADSIRQSEANAADAQFWRDAAETKRRCGSKVACSACLRGRSFEELRERGIEFAEKEDGSLFPRYAVDDPEGKRLRSDQSSPTAGEANPLCGQVGLAGRAVAFPGESSLSKTLSDPGNPRAKKTPGRLQPPS